MEAAIFLIVLSGFLGLQHFYWIGIQARIDALNATEAKAWAAIRDEISEGFAGEEFTPSMATPETKPNERRALRPRKFVGIAQRRMQAERASSEGVSHSADVVKANTRAMEGL